MISKVKEKIRGPDIEYKLKKATNNTKWGPSGQQLMELAMATNSFVDFPILFNALWKRLNDLTKWRHTHKCLEVLEFVLKNGNERVIKEIRVHIVEIQTLTKYQQIEGITDVGATIREKAKQLMELLKDENLLATERRKAKETRGKVLETQAGGGIFVHQEATETPSAPPSSEWFSSNTEAGPPTFEQQGGKLKGDPFAPTSDDPFFASQDGDPFAQQSTSSGEGQVRDPFAQHTSGERQVRDPFANYKGGGGGGGGGGEQDPFTDYGGNKNADPFADQSQTRQQVNDPFASTGGRGRGGGGGGGGGGRGQFNDPFAQQPSMGRGGDQPRDPFADQGQAKQQVNDPFSARGRGGSPRGRGGPDRGGRGGGQRGRGGPDRGRGADAQRGGGGGGGQRGRGGPERGRGAPRGRGSPSPSQSASPSQPTPAQPVKKVPSNDPFASSPGDPFASSADDPFNVTSSGSQVFDPFK